MTGYFLAPALGDEGLRGEVNTRFPKREKASDGWIGDPSHAARVSDHNPCWSCTGRSNGIVRAIDIDISPDGNPDLDLRTELLRVAIGDPRVWYVISNGKIYSRSYGWAPRVYTGDNPHTQHVHVSLVGAPGSGAAGDPSNFDTSPWWDEKPTPPPLPVVSIAAIREAAKHPRRQVAPVQVRRVQQALKAHGFKPGKPDGIYGPTTRAAVKAYELSIRKTGNGLLDVLSGTRLGADRYRLVR